MQQQGRNRTFKSDTKRYVPRLPEPFVPNRVVGKPRYGQNAGYNQVGLNVGYQNNWKSQVDSNYIEKIKLIGITLSISMLVDSIKEVWVTFNGRTSRNL